MVQRNKSEASEGILTRLLGTLALRPVFYLGVGFGLPLQVGRGVFPAIAQGDPVIYDIPLAGTRGFTRSWTRIHLPELMLGAVGSLDTTVGIARARLAPLGGERRNDQQ